MDTCIIVTASFFKSTAGIQLVSSLCTQINTQDRMYECQHIEILGFSKQDPGNIRGGLDT